MENISYEDFDDIDEEKEEVVSNDNEKSMADKLGEFLLVGFQ